jgi:hypothetical protein
MVHGGLTKLFAAAGDLAVSGIMGRLLHRLLAACQEGVPPCREASGGDPQLPRQQVYGFSTEEASHHLGLRLRGKPLDLRTIARRAIAYGFAPICPGNWRSIIMGNHGDTSSTHYPLLGVQ